MDLHSGRSYSYLSLLTAALASSALLTACTGSSGSGSGSSSGVAVTGTLSQATVSDTGTEVSRYEARSAATNTKITLDCGSKGVASGDVDPTTGAFAVTGVPTGVPCSFNFVNSVSKVTKCQVQFQDANNFDLNHKAMSSNSATASSSVSLGAVTCDSTGTINIPSGTIANVSTGTTIPFDLAFNFTGTYTVDGYDQTLPEGYVTAQAGCTSNCGGPGAGDVITLVRFHGVKFTPNSGQCVPSINVTCPVSSGVRDTTQEGYAMSIWGGDYTNGIGACGAKSGFSLDEARAYAGLDLDTTAPRVANQSISYGHYVWSTPAGFGGDSGWAQPWMRTGARSQYAVQDCQPVSVPSTSGAPARPGQACFSQTFSGPPPGTGTGTYIWNVSLQNAGGCLDSSNLPLMVNNWAQITYGSCTNSASAFNSNLSTSTCTYTGSPVAGATSQTFTCSWSGGNFTDLSGTRTSSDNNGPNFANPYAMPMGNYNGQPAALIAQNGTCAGASSESSLLGIAGGAGGNSVKAAARKELLARYRCYANAYWQNSNNGAGSTSCSRNYNFDWATDNYLNFVTGDDRNMKPQNAFITDRVFYSPDGQWAFIKNRDSKYQTLPTATGSTLCPIDELTELKFNRVSDTKILVNLIQKSVMTDRSTACQAAVAAAIAGGGTLAQDPTNLNNLYKQLQTTKMLFYLNKQN